MSYLCMELTPAAVIHILIFNQRLYLHHNIAMSRTLHLGVPVVKYRSFLTKKKQILTPVVAPLNDVSDSLLPWG